MVLDWSNAWSEYETYLEDLSTTVQNCYCFKVLTDHSDAKFVATTTERGDANYGRVMLSYDEYDCPWILFPGAFGDQVSYGIEGGYEPYDSYVCGGAVHTNFYRGWKAVKNEVIYYIEQHSHTMGIVYAGHFMGGSHSLIASSELYKDGIVNPHTVDLYAFGSPNPGNYKVCERINHIVQHFNKAIWYLSFIDMNCFWWPTKCNKDV